MIVHDSAGRPVVMGAEVARGGEAVVYRVRDADHLVAKLYSAPRPGRGEKLAWMRANAPQDPNQARGHAAIAWPRELLFDDARRCRGYLMPYVRNAVPLLEVFNPRLRARTLPGFGSPYLHRAARNLAAALKALHGGGYVVGDLNESNILVTPSALVTVIDVDSFQVKEHKDGQIVVYPCPVGRAEYTPPELQGHALPEVVRQPEHDGFGLAVLLFQLLMDGNHPFRGHWLGRDEPPPLAEKIAQGWFPFATYPSGPVAPPPGAPRLEVLHPELAELFERCFVDGHRDPWRRPSAAEWEQVLAVAEEDLRACRQGHYFSGRLRRCPRCGRLGTAVARRSPQRGAKVAAGLAPETTLVRAGGAAAWALDEVGVRLRGALAAGWRSADRSVRRGLAGVPGPAPLASAFTHRAARMPQAVVRMAVLVGLASALAVAAGLVVMIAWGIVAGLGSPGGPLPSGLWGALIGALGFAIAVGTRDLDPARAVSRLVGQAATVALAAGAGWAAGWLGCAALVGLAGGTGVADLVSRPDGGLVPAGDVGRLLGWTAGWLLYGCVGGVSGPRGGTWTAAAVRGAVFGAAGWLALRLASALATGL